MENINCDQKVINESVENMFTPFKRDAYIKIFDKNGVKYATGLDISGKVVSYEINLGDWQVLDSDYRGDQFEFTSVCAHAQFTDPITGKYTEQTYQAPSIRTVNILNQERD